jgi:peptidoglycan/LPS O-acetylase OafA/YrhL
MESWQNVMDYTAAPSLEAPLSPVTQDGRESTTTSLPARSVLTRHMPGVDLLRGLAILVVVVFHGFYYSSPGLAWHSRIATALFHMTAAGWTGVNLFFALSGFLITGNLLDSFHTENYYARFYIRRALRILPAYFLILLILGLTHTASWNYLAVCVIFLANWPKLLLHGTFTLYGVLWSLAVEEQFYTAWPWLCRRFKGNGLLKLCLAIILICPVLRMTGALLNLHDMFSKTFLIGDNLAMGAVVAILCRLRLLTLRRLVRLGVWVTCVSACALLAILMTGHSLVAVGDVLGASLGYSMLEFFTGGVLILMLCAYRVRPVQPWLRFLIFFGEISYGLYLVHMLCLKLYDHLFGSASLVDGRALLIRFAVANGFAILLATLSKRYFETRSCASGAGFRWRSSLRVLLLSCGRLLIQVRIVRALAAAQGWGMPGSGAGAVWGRTRALAPVRRRPSWLAGSSMKMQNRCAAAIVATKKMAPRMGVGSLP